MAISAEGYFQANPDVAAAYAANSYGLTPEQFAQTHYTNFGAAEGRYLPTWANASQEPVAQTPTAPATTSLVDQILATSDNTQWRGEGKGSARANAEDMANILSGIGVTNIRDFGQITQQVPVYMGDDIAGNPIYENQTQTTYGNTRTGQAVPNTYGERQTGDAFGGTYSGKGNTGYRVQFGADGTPVFYTSEQSSSSLPELMPFIQLALAATGAGGLLGGALNSGLGLGLGSAGTSALGGAALGGLTSAATGGNVLQGAALGGLGGYASGSGMFGGDSSLQAAMDADIAGGMVPEFGTNTAYDAFMQNAMTPAAQAALQTQIASGNGAWLGENVPSGIPEWDNAFLNAGGTFDPAYVNPMDAVNYNNYADPQQGTNDVLSPNVDYNNYASPQQGTNDVLKPAAAAATGLTTSQIANLVKAGVGLVGAGGAASVAANAGGGNSGAVVNPTQGVPTNNPAYYNQLQQYYNAYLPQSPRDVVTPLQQWYNSSYGA